MQLVTTIDYRDRLYSLLSVVKSSVRRLSLRHTSSNTIYTYLDTYVVSTQYLPSSRILVKSQRVYSLQQNFEY